MTKNTRHPDFKEAADKFQEFLQTISRLRDPEHGCPWDLKQTLQSLKKYMLEEAYEACEAVTQGDPKQIAEELGDVLLQVVLNAQLGCEKHGFDISDVIDSINHKMIERHPHVFSGRDDIDTVEKVKDNWQKIKAQSKDKKSKGEDPFQEARDMGDNYPACMQAFKIGRISKKVSFDWDHPLEVLEQLKSEIQELENEVNKAEKNPQAIQDELGDILFTTSQLCRHLKVDPELAGFEANLKFLRRFKQLSELAAQQGVDLNAASREQKESLWQQAKSQE